MTKAHFKLTMLLGSFMVLSAMTPLPHIRGKVVEVQGSRVKIEYGGQYAPNAGDPVKIGFEIGEDFIPVEGEWKILEAGPDFAWAGSVGSGAGTPAVDYIAIISSSQPRKRSALSLPKKEESKTSEVIPFLNAKVEGLRFFETGSDLAPFSERTYKDTFSAATSRHINWELNLQHPDASQRVDFRVTAIYYRPDGSVLTKHSIDSFFEANWKDSFHASGWGWPGAGNWQPGEYNVEIYINDQKVITGAFKVH